MTRHPILAAAMAAAVLSTAPADEYAVRITRVYDGDTPHGDISRSVEYRMPGHRVRVTETWLDEPIRLAGTAAPELKLPAGKVSRDWLAAWLRPGTEGVLTTDRKGTEKYGRPFGRLRVDGKDVGAAVIAAGHAKPWDGKGGQPR
ncbi:MAG TPA: hypothetical protein PLU30_27245 [Verrucomicrobiae bacterium]|nr:hypothetical protein [Verrucomicrobiae bacterium]